jgi:hypothetical protein
MKLGARAAVLIADLTVGTGFGMAERDRDPEDLTEAEIEQQAAAAPDDPITRREEFELDLMEHDDSADGEIVGDEMP